MIPKIIHYCWFGRGEMPELTLKCIESWKHYLPDYELRLWNEDTFDLDMYLYVREAYDNRKFAFVTDVVRLWALEKFGGIYMDTDVEILRSLETNFSNFGIGAQLIQNGYRNLMDLPAFTGYEASLANAPVTGLMASAPHGVWVTEQLVYYKGKHFVKEDASLDLTPNTVPIAQIMVKGGFIIDGQFHVYKDDMYVFPVDYFCPLTSTRILKCTKNTYCIHHFAGSWREYTHSQLFKNWIVEHLLGRKLTNIIVQAKRKIKNIYSRLIY